MDVTGGRACADTHFVGTEAVSTQEVSAAETPTADDEGRSDEAPSAAAVEEETTAVYAYTTPEGSAASLNWDSISSGSENILLGVEDEDWYWEGKLALLSMN